jgi:hypothetical protein
MIEREGVICIYQAIDSAYIVSSALAKRRFNFCAKAKSSFKITKVLLK